MGARTPPMTAIPPLLRRIVKHGWTEELGRRFEAEYGKQLRWQIIVGMERLGMLQFRISPQQADVLSDRRSELYQDTLSDLWIQLLEGVVERYVCGIEQGRIHQGMVAYLRGVIRHILISNARSLGLIGSETPQEMIAAFCQSKRDATRRGRLAWLKFALGAHVRRDLLSRSGAATFQQLHRAIHRVADYFFEEYLPTRCAEIGQLRSRLLDTMLQDFLGSDSLDEAVEYVGSVTPYAAGEALFSRIPGDMDEDEYLSNLDRAAGGRWQ